MSRFNLNYCLGTVLILSFWLLAYPAQAAEVVVYSARIEQLIKPMFDAFTKETGIKVKYTTDNEGALLARLQAEGKNTPKRTSLR